MEPPNSFTCRASRQVSSRCALDRPFNGAVPGLRGLSRGHAWGTSPGLRALSPGHACVTSPGLRGLSPGHPATMSDIFRLQ
jgi:hypothetical protein